MQNVTLEVGRADNAQTRLLEEEVAPLDDGQVLLRVDRFALTANNITYALAGDMLGYWDFFPALDGWGRVPAMGWADVVESTHPDIAVGGRYYGWFPMARYVTLTANPTDDGFRDDGPHRKAHAPVYRAYVSTERDPWYQPGTEDEDRHALLRGLFLTGFLAAEFFDDSGYFGADQVLVLSASSKTAIGLAQHAAANDGPKIIGVTSSTNRDFVASLPCYDEVVVYDEVESVEVAPSVVVDMAGNAAVLASIHERLGDEIAYSMTVGMSHHDAPPAEVTAGPQPQMFFAPTEVTRRRDAWGSDGYATRTTDALNDFVEQSRQWLSIHTTHGPDGAAGSWDEVRNGAVAPSVGRIVTLHDE